MAIGEVSSNTFVGIHIINCIDYVGVYTWSSHLGCLFTPQRTLSSRGVFLHTETIKNSLKFIFYSSEYKGSLLWLAQVSVLLIPKTTWDVFTTYWQDVSFCFPLKIACVHVSVYQPLRSNLKKVASSPTNHKYLWSHFVPKKLTLYVGIHDNSYIMDLQTPLRHLFNNTLLCFGV